MTSSTGGWSRSNQPGIVHAGLPAPCRPPLHLFPDTAPQLRADPPQLQGRGLDRDLASAESPPARSTFPIRLAASEPRPEFSKFLVGEYDEDRGQFVLVRPRDEQRVPFELRADLFTQARYFDFARSAEYWIDSTGARRRSAIRLGGGHP